MTLRHTGPGRIATNPNVPVGGIRATLGNFDIDGDALKPEFTLFLRTRVAPILTARNARIWLQGSASHSGTDRHNLALSNRRAHAVATFLASCGVRQDQMRIEAVGEGMATPGVMEAAMDRSVSLLAAPLYVPPPPPPPRPPVPAGPPTETRFQIKLHAALAAGIGPVMTEFLIFQIWDHTNRLTSFYRYHSGGGGRSIGPPASATLAGPWNDFTTSGRLAVNRFAGAARFTTAGTAWWTSNHLNMMGLPPGVATVPRVLDISTGFTIGLGASTSVGTMVIVDPTPWPFAGP